MSVFWMQLVPMIYFALFGSINLQNLCLTNYLGSKFFTTFLKAADMTATQPQLAGRKIQIVGVTGAGKVRSVHLRTRVDE
jgi:hypothetical protein